MKGFIIAFIFILSCSISKGQQVIIKYPGYTSYYNTQTNIPDSVIWIAAPHTKVCDRDDEFHCTGNRKNFREDYLHSGYDIGHNCDASDENGTIQDEYNSFDFANTYPQWPDCNRGPWLGIESYTRKLNQPVRVKVYCEGIAGYLGPDNIAIPKLCIKEIWYAGHHEKYIVPNIKGIRNVKISNYKVI